MENHQLSISSATNSSFTVTDKHDTAFSPTATITVDPEAQLEKGDATTTDTPAAAGPPDGGYGWVVVACSFLNNFAMLGIMFSWGIFQQLYSTDIFPGKASSVSWIGTLAFGFMYICGGCFSMFAARIGYRKMICTGSFLVGGGLIAASFSTEVRVSDTNSYLLYPLDAHHAVLRNNEKTLCSLPNLVSFSSSFCRSGNCI